MLRESVTCLKSTNKAMAPDSRIVGSVIRPCTLFSMLPVLQRRKGKEHGGAGKAHREVRGWGQGVREA